MRKLFKATLINRVLKQFATSQSEDLLQDYLPKKMLLVNNNEIHMKLTKEIIPGVCLAGIFLERDIDEVAGFLSSSYQIERKNGIAVINQGLITIGYGADKKIYSVTCNPEYNESYEGKLWAGMTVKDVLKTSSTQVAMGGCVVVDNIDGIGLPLPDGLDDFERITDYLDLDFKFEHMSVFRKWV